MQRSLINGGLFNLGWFAVIYTQSNLLAPLLTLVLVAVHMRFIAHTRRELLVIAAVFAFGLVLDQMLFTLGLFTLEGASALAPLWLSCLWPLLATTLLHAFAFLHQRWLMAAALGAVGGCASYIAGTGMSAIAFGSALYGPIVIAALWGLLLPALLYLAITIVPAADEEAAPI